MEANLDRIIPEFTIEDVPISFAPFVKINWNVSCRFIDENGKAFKDVLATATAISKFGLIISFEEDKDTPSTIFVATVSEKNKKIGVRCKTIHSNYDSKRKSISLLKYEVPEESSIKFIRAVITSYNLSKCRSEIRNEVEPF